MPNPYRPENECRTLAGHLAEQTVNASATGERYLMPCLGETGACMENGKKRRGRRPSNAADANDMWCQFHRMPPLHEMADELDEDATSATPTPTTKPRGDEFASGTQRVRKGISDSLQWQSMRNDFANKIQLTQADDAVVQSCQRAATLLWWCLFHISGHFAVFATAVDSEEQVVLGKAQTGSIEGFPEQKDAVGSSFAGWTYLRPRPKEALVVEKANEDSRFRNNSMVVHRPHMLSCCSVPILLNGFSVGAVCVKCLEARSWQDLEVELVGSFAEYLADELAQLVHHKTGQPVAAGCANNPF